MGSNRVFEVACAVVGGLALFAATLQTEQSFQVEEGGKFFGYAAPEHSITTFVW